MSGKGKEREKDGTGEEREKGTVLELYGEGMMCGGGIGLLRVGRVGMGSWFREEYGG